MELAWAESRLNEKLIRKRRAILGPHDGDDETFTILNRWLTWVCLSGSRKQSEIEAGPRLSVCVFFQSFDLGYLGDFVTFHFALQVSLLWHISKTKFQK